MSARDDLSRLLDQWQQLTQAEATAIQTAAWPALGKIQAAKAVLQKSLDPLCQESACHKILIARLISLEARNAELLAAQMARARSEQAALQQTQRTLHKIQRTYTRPLSPEWHGYS